LAATPIDFIRRQNGARYQYFLANLEAQPFAGWVALGVPVTSALVRDPLSGRSGIAELDTSGNRARIYLQLQPGESLIVATTSGASMTGTEWAWYAADGDPIAVEGHWGVEFTKGGPELPPPTTTDSLVSWTDFAGVAAERFAGTARYRLEFEAPEVDADAWRLDLGDIRDSARVRLNGRDIGTVWSLPFQLDLNGALVPGPNTLEIEVTNVAANRIRDMDRQGVDWKIMREINFVNVRYEPFDASHWAIEPAGLLGPIELVPLKRVSPE
jgi:hypothetical protein